MCSVSFISMGLVISNLFISTEPHVCCIYLMVVLVLGSVPGVSFSSLSLQGSSPHTFLNVPLSGILGRCSDSLG